jgi:hypothetical protein
MLAVNGAAYGADAIRAAKQSKSHIELIIRNDDRYSVIHVDYHDGLRYPRLERDTAAPARLDDIVAARP